jgi:hypothetical protein
MAGKEADGLRCNYAGTEHLLLALLQLEGKVKDFFDDEGIGYAKTRQMIRELLGCPGPK